LTGVGEGEEDEELIEDIVYPRGYLVNLRAWEFRTLAARRASSALGFLRDRVSLPESLSAILLVLSKKESSEGVLMPLKGVKLAQ